MPTIKDIATQAGVSTATVSRVINGEKVSEETRESVNKAIKLFGYKPNHIARSLKTQKTHTIGFVVPDYGQFFMQIANVIEDVLNDYGYCMIVCYSNENLDLEKAKIKMLMEKKVDGVLLVPTSDHNDYILELIENGIPLVLIDRVIKDLQTDCVLVDNVNGAYQAVEHLVNKGFRRIGVINGRQEVTTGEERFRGYLRVFEDFNLQLNQDIIRFGDFSTESGYLLMKNLMSLRCPPDAVFVANSYMTVGVMLAVKEMGIKVPYDVAIVSFDDNEFTQLAVPSITAISQPVREIGEMAANLLYKKIRNHHSDVQRIHRLKTNLVIREST